MKAAWYGRVSSLAQVEDGSSLQTQREKCEAAIEARSWDLTEGYVDAGISGARNDRPEWQRLIADCRAGRIQAVVVSSLDRMARSAVHAIEITNELHELGVTVVVLRENLDLSTPAGRMMRTMLAGVAEMERELIRERSINGQRAKSKRAGWPGGRPPYGWRLVGSGRDTVPTADEDERRALRLMYTWIVREGVSTGVVTQRLAELGITSRTGLGWNYNVVRRMLSNTALVTGEYQWGMSSGRAANGRYYKSQTKDGKPVHGEPVTVALGDPPFTQAEFDELQQALGRAPRANAKQPTEVTQMLSGRIYGECGKHWTGVRVAERQGYRAIYRCTGRRRIRHGYQQCGCVQVHAVKLDERVWAHIVRTLGDRATLEQLAAEWLRLGTAEDPDEVRATAEMLAARVAKLERAIKRAREQWLFADEPDEARATLDRLRDQLEQARRKQEAAQVVSPAAQANARQLTDLAALADRAASRLDAMGPEERRELVTLLQVEVHISGPVSGGEPAGCEVRGILHPVSSH